jgi:hypothetical protein
MSQRTYVPAHKANDFDLGRALSGALEKHGIEACGALARALFKRQKCPVWTKEDIEIAEAEAERMADYFKEKAVIK